MDNMILEKTYWSQFRVVRFQQQLSDDSGDSLALPKIFVENVKDKLGASAKLKTKNGSEWVVKLEASRNGDVFLTTGWKEFVHVHCLKKDDTVMFKHSGNFEFKVTMFDGKTGGENVFGHFVKNIELQPRVVELETQNDLEESSKRCKLERTESSDSDCETVFLHEEEPPSADSLYSSQCPRKTFTSEGTTFVSEKMQAFGKIGPLRIQRPKKYQCLKRARALEIEKPGDFLVYLSACYVKRPYVLALSGKWAMKHRLDEHDVELHIGGKTWPVRVFTRETGQAGMCSGWRDFVYDNGLQEGDVCFFTVLAGSTDPVTINVRIVQGVKTADEVLKSSSGWNLPETQNDLKERGLDCETVLPHVEQPLSADSLNSSQYPGKRPRLKGTSFFSEKMQEFRKIDRVWIQRPKKEHCLRRARALEIEKPGDCMVYLCASYVKRPYVWHVPRKWIKKHTLDRSRAVELHIDGMAWPVNIFVREAASQAGIYAGRDFVEDNGLQEGDVCSFTVIPGSTDPVTINVRIVQVDKTAGDVLEASSDGKGKSSGWNLPETQSDLKESSRRCKFERTESSDKDRETVLPREEVPQDADSPGSIQFPRTRPRSEGTISCSKKRQVINRIDMVRKKEQCLRRARALEIAKSGDYVVYISGSYVRHPYRLHVRWEWVKDHELDGPRDVELHINGMAWPVKVFVRQARSEQAGICLGRQLVEANGLQEGDVFFFTVVPGLTDPITINVRIVRGVKTAYDVVNDSSDGNGNSSSCYFPEPENFEDSVPSYAYDQWF